MRMGWRLAAAAALVGCAAIVGCGKADDGMSKEQVQKSNRMDEIVKKSGGDWDKIPQGDRDYLIKEVASGSEPTARMLVQAQSGKLRGNRGGPSR